MTLQEKIVRYRARHNLTQRQFGELIGVTKQTVYGIENGLQDPSKMTMMRIDILFEKENEQNNENQCDEVETV